MLLHHFGDRFRWQLFCFPLPIRVHFLSARCGCSLFFLAFFVCVQCPQLCPLPPYTQPTFLPSNTYDRYPTLSLLSIEIYSFWFLFQGFFVSTVFSSVFRLFFFLFSSILYDLYCVLDVVYEFCCCSVCATNTTFEGGGEYLFIWTLVPYVIDVAQESF